jgi:hypothetical protein
MRRSPIRSRPETAARLVPGNQGNGTAVDLPNAAVDFLPPGFFRGNVNRSI